MNKYYEINFDGIVGPTHNYAGLSHGNMASMNHKEKSSNPKEAALQGLKKMKTLFDLGLKQGVLPPHSRPHIPTLKQMGFCGTDSEIIEKAYNTNKSILLNCSSASSMWTANSGTFTPSRDSTDQKAHFTPANLATMFHRNIEVQTTYKIFQKYFSNPDYFRVHRPLPGNTATGDEGAANHNRLAASHNSPGVHLFVFGKYAFKNGMMRPKYFPARQTFEASQAVSNLHQLTKQNSLIVQQNPLAIDNGVFHNDVISVANEYVFFYHDLAFFDGYKTIEDLKKMFFDVTGVDLCLVSVSAHEVTVAECVSSYLFNSQLVTLPNGDMALISPGECERNKVVKKCIEKIISSTKNPINKVIFMDLRQSMNNGGGPACLRLRTVLNDQEIAAMHQPALFSDELYDKLTAWVEKNYREELKGEDFKDPQLLSEVRQTLDELTQILDLGSIYDFQQNG